MTLKYSEKPLFVNARATAQDSPGRRPYHPNEGLENLLELNTQFVVVADDHAIVRRSMVEMLSTMDRVDVVAEVGDGLGAIAAVKRHQPSLLLLDAAMPLARGIEVFSECRRWSPDTAVILLTGFTSPAFLTDWIQSGVNGILLKTCELEEMRQGIEVVLAGGHFLAGQVRSLINSELARKPLTLREHQVLTLIVSGDRNKAIGEKLCISAKTVEKHRATIMQKFGVHSISELMITALRQGLLDDWHQL